VFDAPSSAETAQDEAREQRAARRLRVLEELAEIGLAIARGLREQAAVELAQARHAQASWTPADGEPRVARSEVGPAYARVSRAVRQTVALEERLDCDRKARAGKARTGGARTGGTQTGDIEPWADDAGEWDESAGFRGRVHKDMVRQAIGRAIQDEAPESDAENLLTDLHERLEDPSDDAEIAEVPIYELLERTCRDLGLTADDSLRVNEEWGAEAAEAPDARPAEYGPAILKAAMENLEIQKAELRAALDARSRDGPDPGEPAPRRRRTP
jgi:hypothetical protein